MRIDGKLVVGNFHPDILPHIVLEFMDKLLPDTAWVRENWYGHGEPDVLIPADAYDEGNELTGKLQSACIEAYVTGKWLGDTREYNGISYIVDVETDDAISVSMEVPDDNGDADWDL